jgi:flavin-dependent dehydrogenase
MQLLHSYPHLKNRFKNAKLTGKIEAGRLPYYSGPCQVSGDNFLLLGDAARLIDPFTGEGIGNAMASGRYAGEIASECIASGNFSHESTIKYQHLIESRLVPELALSLKLQRLARRENLLNLVIGRASRNENTRKLISEMLYNPAVKNRLSKPGFYIKILLGL